MSGKKVRRGAGELIETVLDLVRHEAGIGDHAPAIGEHARVPIDLIGEFFDFLLVRVANKVR